MSTINVTIHTLAGVPDQAAVRPALDRVLAPFLHLGMRVDNGPTLTGPADLDALHNELASRERGGFTARGRSAFEVVLSWHDVVGVDDIGRTGTLSLFADLDAIDIDAVIEATGDAVDLLGAPMGTIELTNGPYTRMTDDHRTIYQEDKVGSDRVFGLGRGLSGLAWCNFLGPALVDFLDAERLRALGADFATERSSGNWILRTGGTIDAPPYPAAVIELLGADRFYDPATGALPTVVPSIPDRTALPHRIRMRNEEGELVWQTSTGATGAAPSGAPASGPDPIDLWNGAKDAYMEARAVQLWHGFVPQIIVVQGEGDRELTAILASPDVQYVIPEVDVVLSGPVGSQRWIPFAELTAALANHARVEASHRFSWADVEYEVGVAHWTDDDNQHADAVADALRTLGQPVDRDQIIRLR